jgi:hypothetical protein
VGDDLKQTIKIQRDAKVGMDSRGRSVWTKPIEPTEFELVSTVMLRKILDSDDEDKKRKIRDAADGGDGVLAQDTSTDKFEIISDAELQKALAQSDGQSASNRSVDVVPEPLEKADGDEELSLVTTQVLRRILGTEAPDEQGGYNPYDSR